MAAVTDLSAILDAAAADKDRQDWLRAREDGFGCSDLGALWLILGWAGADVFDWHQDAEGKWRSNLYTEAPNGEKDYVTPVYLRQAWETVDSVLVPNAAALPMCAVCNRRIEAFDGGDDGTRWRHLRSDYEPHDIYPKDQRKRVPCGLPRLIAEKAGIVGPRPSSDAQEEGKHKERALFQHSRLGRFDTQAFYAPDDARMAPPGWRERIVAGQDGLEGRPLVVRDLVEPRLLCTVEAWEYAPKGMIAWELKTDRLGLRTKPPWAQRFQAIGQAVVLGAEAWGIQYGPEWAKTDDPAFPNLRDPVQWGPFEVREQDRSMIRQAVGAGWAMVEKAKGQK